jgi:hypothetical protein
MRCEFAPKGKKKAKIMRWIEPWPIFVVIAWVTQKSLDGHHHDSR